MYGVLMERVKISVAWGTPKVRLNAHGGVVDPVGGIHADDRTPGPPGRVSFAGFVVGPVGAAGRIVKPVEKRSLSSPAGLLLLKWFFIPMTSALKSWAEMVKLLEGLSQRIHWLWSNPMLKAHTSRLSKRPRRHPRMPPPSC